MSISHETQERINRFAKEQSQHYLDVAEMTYMEKLRRKMDQAKRKVGLISNAVIIGGKKR